MKDFAYPGQPGQHINPVCQWPEARTSYEEGLKGEEAVQKTASQSRIVGYLFQHSSKQTEVSVVVFVAKSLSIAASCLNERMNPVRFEPGWARIRSNVRNDNIIVR